MEVAVFIGGEDGFGNGEIGLRFVCGREVFLLETSLGFQDNPLDVMDVQHGVCYGADFDGDVVAVLFDHGDMLLICSVGGVGGDGCFVFDYGFGRDDLVVDFVEVHGVLLSDQGIQIGVVVVVGFGDVLVGEVAKVAVDAGFDHGTGFCCFFQPLFCDLETVFQGGVSQGNGAGAGNGAGHVADAVVDHAVQGVDGVVVGGDMGGFAAAALVDGDIHEDGAGFHFLQVFLLEELGGGAAGDQDGADDQVGVLQDALNVGVGGDQGLDVGAEEVVQLLQAFEVHVQDGHVGAHAHGNLAGVHAHGAAAEDDHVGFRGAGYAGQEDAFAAEALFKVLGAFLDGKSSGDLGHGGQAGQGAVRFLDGLVGHRFDFALQEGVHLFLVRGQVEVGVEDQSVMEEGIFLFQGFLDLDHHINQVPDVGGVVDQGSARVHIFIVGEAGADACSFFHVDVVACGHIGFHVVRGQAHAVFVVLDLFDAADLHGWVPSFCLFIVCRFMFLFTASLCRLGGFRAGSV